MKFTVYNQSNSKNFVAGKPTLRVSEKSGLFSFSKAAVQLMDAENLQKIHVLQNQESLEDFYVVKTQDDFGFVLRGKAGGSLAFNSVLLATRILDRGQVITHTTNLKRTNTFYVGKSQEIDGEQMHLIILSKPTTGK